MTCLLAPALSLLVLTSGPAADPRSGEDPGAPGRRAAHEAALARLVPAPQDVETRAPDARLAPDPSGCALLRNGAETTPVEGCLACHTTSGSGHPVGMGYAAATARPGARLRPAAEVIRAGVFLPDGEVRCTTCHDGRSRVRFRLALPPGAELRPAVVLGDPSTYEPGPPRAPETVEAGAHVGARPLCVACHAM